MAAGNRENQGLQIACILLVMVTIVLAVSTYVLYRKSEESVNSAFAAEEEKKKALDLAAKERDRVRALKHFIGFGDLTEADLDVARASFDEEMKQIEAEFRQDISLFGDTTEAKNYRELPKFLDKSIRSRNEQVAKLAEREGSLIKEREKIEQDEKQKTDLALSEAKRRAEELLKVQSTYDASRGQWEQQSTALRTQFTQRQTDFQAKIADAAKKSEELAKQIQVKQDLIEEQKRRLTDITEHKVEVPVGKVTFVNQRSRTVYINLGTADGLQRTVTFSVYDQKLTDISNAKPKASIEVKKTIDAHLSEAAIISDASNDPILPNDQIHSAAWRPGRQIEFAMAGFFDMNKDGKSDRNLVKNLVTANNGKIVCEVDDDGKMTGQLSLQTTYLLIGERPTEESGPDAIKGFTNMFQKAQELGIEIMVVGKFLDSIGYRGETGTKPLGRDARPDDFKPRAPEGAREPASLNRDTFKPRTPPPARGKQGAF